jgi:uncharacterized membrane protein YeaQ/YmgE (transglycosylase-associated protein family)
MSKRRMVLLRIAGSVVGLLVVGVAVGVALFFCLQPEVFILAGLGFLCSVVLGTVGAAAGATVTQKLLKQRSSFWRALLVAVVGLVVGAVCFQLLMLADSRRDPNNESGLAVVAICAGIIILFAAIVAGAVIGSGWKAKPRDAASPPG